MRNSQAVEDNCSTLANAIFKIVIDGTTETNNHLPAVEPTESSRFTREDS